MHTCAQLNACRQVRIEVQSHRECDSECVCTKVVGAPVVGIVVGMVVVGENVSPSPVGGRVGAFVGDLHTGTSQ